MGDAPGEGQHLLFNRNEPGHSHAQHSRCMKVELGSELLRKSSVSTKLEHILGL